MEIMVVKEFTFDSAHYLPDHDGKCKNLHGHTYRLQIGIKGEIDPNSGMVVDFAEVKRLINQIIIEPLDHSYLNDKLPYFNPTVENMVMWIVEKLRGCISDEWPWVWLSLVRLYETPTSYAEWAWEGESYDKDETTGEDRS